MINTPLNSLEIILNRTLVALQTASTMFRKYTATGRYLYYTATPTFWHYDIFKNYSFITTLGGANLIHLYLDYFCGNICCGIIIGVA